MSSQPSKKRKGKEEQKASSNKKQKTNSTLTEETNQTGIFSNLVLYILQAGIGKARAEIFSKQVAKFSGKLQNNLSPDVTHLIVDEQMDIDRLCRILKIDEPPFDVKIVKASWISNCLSEQKVVSTEEHEIKIPVKYLKTNDSNLGSESNVNREPKKLDDTSSCKKTEELESAGTKKHADGEGKPQDIPSTSVSDKEAVLTREDVNIHWRSPTKKGDVDDSDDSSYIPSDDDDEDQQSRAPSGQSSSNASTPNASPAKLPKGNWVCSRPSSSIVVNHNKLITDKLEVLLKVYENTRDRWRALSYKKAISALSRHPKAITSWQEANEIPGIGKALADKVWEIARTGHLRKIDHVCKGEEMEALNLFNNIWGVGPTVSQEWVQQGLRTLDDVREKAKLNYQQEIGMKHYDDFLERMPREEAGQIERTVREMAQTIHPKMLAVVCGSYRRGKQTCGDVDVLISHPDNKSHKGVLPKLLDKLRKTGFITDDLIRVEEEVGEQRKYMGVCRLPGENTKYRRIDIIVAPYSEYPCALLHFTGSGHFNRSMRALAKKKGMSLSEHALCTGVVRSGTVKINKGTSLPVNSEEDVFRYLGLEYRDPEERDH
ncbi:DNA polymerase lambda-like [Amphiura filiformis]|uniref:DNA polymerase lambda-like n=1 Tax=Amphiura filiformis TaxID=82378 RepID=UPI003B2249BB